MNNSGLILVDKNISKSSADFISRLGVDMIKTVEVSGICDSTSTHPDMQFLKIAYKRALVEKSTYNHYSGLLTDFELIPVDNIHSPYPDDCVLNVTIIGNRCFLTEYQDKIIGEYLTDYDKIIVNQGYTKCNICVLNENAILTSDRGISKTAQKFGFKVYFLPDDEIALKGYKNGFWGGCSGFLDNNKLFFNGDIEKLSCYNELLNILKKEKIEPLYNREGELYDIGSIITVI